MVPTSPLSSEAARSPSRTKQTTPLSAKSESGSSKGAQGPEAAGGGEPESSKPPGGGASNFVILPSRKESGLNIFSCKVSIIFWTSRSIDSELCSRRPTTSAKEGLLLSLHTALFLNSPPDRALATTHSRAAKRSASTSSRCVTGKGNAATEFSILHILTSTPRLTSATCSRRASKSAASPDGGVPRHPPPGRPPSTPPLSSL
mmetsp:Transcript_9801/g.26048  ORF Transcript_9801/g.26048 Transcript_9801/m.26048 type:complete len:203 (-) Transcript_9801:798-1406(-)